MTEVVDKTFPFERTTQDRLTAAIASLIPLYADIATQGDQDFALKQLKAHLREHVVWERNTVWREMIGLERRGWGGTDSRSGIDVPIVEGQQGKKKVEVYTPVGRFFLPRWLNSQVLAGSFAILLFIGLINADWFDRVEEQNCLALLAFVTIFWALEVSSSLQSRQLVLIRHFRSFPCSSRR
jgi:phosphate transporter